MHEIPSFPVEAKLSRTGWKPVPCLSAARRVAQIFNLLYRRISFGSLFASSAMPEVRTASGFQIGDTAECNSALRERRGTGWSSPVSIVILYALAMAWVESAVVFYLRSMVGRLEPYQPHPLPLETGFGFAEIVREAATLIMLLTVGALAGRTWRSRLAHTLLAFGVWDIAYYIWLVPLTGWPHSLADWDVLFLIPLPWWGPVWAPVSIAALMIVFGSTVARHDTPERPLWPGRAALGCAMIGASLALYVFMADSIRLVLNDGTVTQLRDLLPVWFNWPVFLVALGLMAAPVVQVARRGVLNQKEAQ